MVGIAKSYLVAILLNCFTVVERHSSDGRRLYAFLVRSVVVDAAKILVDYKAVILILVIIVVDKRDFVYLYPPSIL